MQHLVERSRGIIRNRGWWGFAKFFFSRMVRGSEDLVFERTLDADTGLEDQQFGDQIRTYYIDNNNINDPSIAKVVELALAGEDAVYRDELLKQGLLLAAMSKEELIHVTFVQFETSYKKLLGESASVPLIGNCWTAPPARGRGIYPKAIKMVCAKMLARGHRRIVISCAPDNYASIAGITKAGFTRIRAVSNFIFVTKFALQIARNDAGRTFKVVML